VVLPGTLLCLLNFPLIMVLELLSPCPIPWAGDWAVAVPETQATCVLTLTQAQAAWVSSSLAALSSSSSSSSGLYLQRLTETQLLGQRHGRGRMSGNYAATDPTLLRPTRDPLLFATCPVNFPATDSKHLPSNSL